MHDFFKGFPPFDGAESPLEVAPPKDYYLDFPPFSSDPVEVLTADEFFSGEELPANHNYERVMVGEGGDYADEAALYAYLDGENSRRIASYWVGGIG